MIKAFQLIWILVKHRLDRLIPTDARPLWLTILIFPLRLLPAPSLNAGKDLASALVELGPAFIKVGQLLSTRRDLFPDEVIEGLSTLQDQVPPFEHEVAISLIEASLGQPVGSVFSQIDATPIASASIAQVYGATLKTGEAVVLKVLRPNIKAAVEQDLNRIETMFNWINASWKDAYRLKLTQVLSDYRQVILAETSLTREADNAERLRDFWLPRGKLYVPLMYREYSSDSLLVMERVHGTIVTNLTTLKDNHVNLSKLSQLGVEIFFTQVFEDNFFHADMHPGNILVNHQDPENPTYIALDCAIIGQLTREDRNYLAKNLVAFFNEDYSAVASLHIESGWVPQSTSPTEMEAVIRQTCEPLFGKPMAEIEFGKLLVALFQAAQAFDMSIQPQLVLLQKTLLNIEGIGRQLHGELDLWQTAKPFLDQWMADRKSPSAHLERIKDLVPLLLTEGPELPEQILKAPRRIEQILMANRQLEDQLTNLQAALSRSRQIDQYRRYSMFLLGLSLLCFLPALTSEPGSLSVWRGALGSVAIIAALLVRGIRPK